MAINTPSDAGQPAAEQSKFTAASNEAGLRFAGELQVMPLTNQIVPRAADNGTLGLPWMVPYDSAQQLHGGAAKPEQDLPARIVKTIGANEGALTRITRNDNGHGISVGIRQWNQEVGELPDLLKSMHDRDPQKFNATFGTYARNLLKEGWVRHADMAGNPDLMRRLSKALHDPEFQQVQMDKAREFAQRSIEKAHKYGLKTEQGAALVADITNQLGEGGAHRVMARAGLHPGRPVKDEKAILARMERLSYRPNSRDRFNAIASAFNDGALIRHDSTGDDISTLI